MLDAGHFHFLMNLTMNRFPFIRFGEAAYDFRSDVCKRAICRDFWHTQCLRLWKQKESVLIRFKMMRLINQKFSRENQSS